jgi:hypothetical protein
MKTVKTILLSAAITAILVSPHAAHCQQKIAPMWVKDAWRSSQYPASQWCVGFSQDGVRPGATASAEAIKRVEMDAQNKLAESIISRVASASLTQTSSTRTQQGAQSKEAVTRDYAQIILVSTRAEVAKTESYSWYDAENNRIYALTVVRKSALSSYYAAQIEAALRDAERNLSMAKQSIGLGKRGDAESKLSEAQARAESTAAYRNLLLAVDSENGVALSQSARVAEILSAVSAARAASEDAMAVFVTGTETILTAKADIIVPGLQAVLNDSNIRIAENRAEAAYILTIDAKACNATYDGDFHHTYACVKITLTNAKTGKNEVTTNITGPKGSRSDAHAAAELAFTSAVPYIWEKVKGKIMAN